MPRSRSRSRSRSPKKEDRVDRVLHKKVERDRGIDLVDLTRSSQERSEKKRSRSRSRSRERSRDRDRHRRHRRSRSRSRDKGRRRSRERRPRERSDRGSGRHDRDRPRRERSESSDEDCVIFEPANRVPVTEEELQSMPEDEQDIMRVMGFKGFDTTKDKQVVGNDLYAANICKKRRYRQYMNRKGGFNRPLDFIA